MYQKNQNTTKADKSAPPRFFSTFLQWYCNPEKLEEIEGDLEEIHTTNYEIYGRKKANFKFAWNVIRCCKPYAWKRSLDFSNYYFNFIMIFNYIRIARRVLLKNKTFSLINIFGLSFSMSVCLLIISVINDHLSYDSFHKEGDRIYRVITDVQQKDRGPNFLYASTVMPVANTLKDEYTGMEEVVRISKSLNGDFKSGDKIVQLDGIFADQSFLNVFSFRLKAGNPDNALNDPYSAIITEQTADKLFEGEDPLGQLIEINNQGAYTVTGILEQPPGKSHITFDLIGSMSTLEILEKENVIQYNKVLGEWGNPYASYVYILLDHGTNPDLVDSYLMEISDQHKDASDKHISKFQLQELSSITPSPVMNNMFNYTLPTELIISLGFLALVIMLSACFNYTNLSISRALSRAKEVGIRKVSGAKKWQIVLQFLTESVLFSLISLAFALIMQQYLIQAFNRMNLMEELSLRFVDNTNTYILFIAFSILVGLVAGITPALFLSSFQPIRVLKNFAGIKLFSRINLRKSLIVLQFTLSLFFIITAIVINRQSNLLINSDYGFSKENIVNIRLQDADADQYLSEVSKRTNVIGYSASSHIPATGERYGCRLRRNPEDDKLRSSFFYVDQNYIDNLDITLIAGNNFPENASRNNEQFIILNKKAIQDLKFSNPHEAIGESLLLDDNDSTLFQIIGVVENYSHRIQILEMSAMALRYKPNAFRYANIKLKSDHMEATLMDLENIWRKYDQVHTFDSKFFDDQLEEAYGFVKDIRGIIGLIAILAVIVASLGLFGMAIYNAESRVKEVGIRKILGASIIEIIVILSKGFLYLIVMAVIIAIPLAYFVNNLWLEQIANRVSIGPGLISYAIVILLGIAVSTIISQSIRAAFVNPAVSLKDE